MNVSIVDKRKSADLPESWESLQVNFSFVTLFAQTGVHGDLAQRQVIQYGGECQAFIRLFPSQSHFDGEADLRISGDNAEQCFHLFGIRKDAGAVMTFRQKRERTA